MDSQVSGAMAVTVSDVKEEIIRYNNQASGAMAVTVSDVKEEIIIYNNLVSGAMAARAKDIKAEKNRLNNESKIKNFSNVERTEVSNDQSIELDQRQLNIVILHLKELCSKNLSDASISSINRSPPDCVEDDFIRCCSKCGPFERTRKRSADNSNYILASKKDKNWKSEEEDAETQFFSTMMSHVKNIPEYNNLEWQIHCLTLFKRYGY